jgi:hypothetical protein
MSVAIRQGQFWWVDDNVIVFPEERDRTPHKGRGCIVVEGNESLDMGGKRVQIVPTSSQTHLKGVYDVIIPSPPLPGGAEYVALIQHVQPILRHELTSLCIPLKDEWTDRILAAILKSLGITVGEEIPF